MKTLIVLIAMAAAGLAALIVRQARARARRKHDPIEYYRGWNGYRHPIHLENRITKEEADAVAASGSAHLIGYFDADGKPVRVVKMLRGAVFFEFVYAYHPGGKLKSVKATNPRGDVTVREYGKSGHAGFFW
jgi:hypothetical protein